MKDRLITVAGTLIAMMLIVGMFLQPSANAPVTLPTSVEVGPNGYRGLAGWITSGGIPVVSHTEKFDTLGKIEGKGHLLVTTVPHQKMVSQDEVVELLRWVALGNGLVILATLDDTPDWSLAADTSSFTEDIERLSGTVFEAATDDDGEIMETGGLFEDTEVALVPIDTDAPLNTNVARLVGVSNSTASVWIPAEDSLSPGHPFLAEASSNLAAGWLDRHGDGTIVTIAVGSLFTNRALANVDNRHLMINLLRWHMGPEGGVIFDDYHQGLSSLYDPEAFFSDARVGITVLFVLAFWFVYMTGTHNRLMPVRRKASSPRQGDFVAAIGGFLARKVGRAEVARLMFDRWFAELENRGASEASQSPWSYLAASPLVDREALRALQAAYDRTMAGEAVDLKTLNNNIQSIREALG